MTRHEIVRALGPPDLVFKDLSLLYHTVGNLGFDGDDRCDVVGTAVANQTVVVEGIRLEGRFGDLAAELAAHGHQVVDSTGAVDFDFSYCDDLGIVLVRAAPFDADAQLCAVQAWAPGYWERQPPGVRSA